jgi:hypothetical protein
MTAPTLRRAALAAQGCRVEQQIRPFNSALDGALLLSTRPGTTPVLWTTVLGNLIGTLGLATRARDAF